MRDFLVFWQKRSSIQFMLILVNSKANYLKVWHWKDFHVSTCQYSHLLVHCSRRPPFCSQIFGTQLKKAPAECRKFENKMADVENIAQEGENIDTYWRESLFNFINDITFWRCTFCLKHLIEWCKRSW